MIEVGAKDRANHSAMGQRTEVVSVGRGEHMEQDKTRQRQTREREREREREHIYIGSKYVRQRFRATEKNAPPAAFFSFVETP